MLNGSRLYYKTMTYEKNYAFCSVLQGHPAVASPKERLYEQMTPNPAFTERNIQKSNAHLPYSRQEQKSLVTYHTLQSLYVCVSLVNTLISTAPIGSGHDPIIFMRSPTVTCEQWVRNLSSSSADVRGAETRDEPLSTSAWEAICYEGYHFHLACVHVLPFLWRKPLAKGLLSNFFFREGSRPLYIGYVYFDSPKEKYRGQKCD